MGGIEGAGDGDRLGEGLRVDQDHSWVFKGANWKSLEPLLEGKKRLDSLDPDGEGEDGYSLLDHILQSL